MGQLPDGLYDTVVGVIRQGRKILRALSPNELSALQAALERRERGEVEDDQLVAEAPESAQPWLREVLANADKKWWIGILLSLLIWIQSDRSSASSTRTVTHQMQVSQQQAGQEIQQLSEQDRQLQQLVQQMLAELQAEGSGQSIKRDPPQRATPPATDQVPPETLPRKNDPCWCGSGRRFRRCHLGYSG